MKAIRNSAKALIVRDGRLLVSHLTDAEGGWYVLPGGGQERMETLHEAVKRECREELDVEIVVHELLFIREYLSINHEFANFAPDEHQIEFIFRCSLPNGVEPGLGSLPDTAQIGIAWLSMETLSEHCLYPRALSAYASHFAGRGGAPVYLGDVN